MSILIRPYSTRDATALEAICRETAAERPFLPIVDDVRLASFFYAEPYLSLEPESALVAELDGKVVGYLVAARDTPGFQRQLSAHLARRWPELARLHLTGTVRGGHRSWLSQRFFLRQYYDMLTRRTTLEGGSVVDFSKYPAHCHLQVAPSARAKSVGLMLMLRFQQSLKQAGVAGQHCMVMEPAGHHAYSRMMQALGAELLRDTTFTRAEQPALVDSRVWHERILVRAL